MNRFVKMPGKFTNVSRKMKSTIYLIIHIAMIIRAILKFVFHLFSVNPEIKILTKYQIN
jgi:hypothetical protein